MTRQLRDAALFLVSFQDLQDRRSGSIVYLFDEGITEPQAFVEIWNEWCVDAHGKPVPYHKKKTVEEWFKTHKFEPAEAWPGLAEELADYSIEWEWRTIQVLIHPPLKAGAPHYTMPA